ncbi:MAG: PhoH family protein [Candidatus Marinimicrobia bacterium]|nr:PhoH family protein [Candidatus Neomarinimicrobiota bacterium]
MLKTIDLKGIDLASLFGVADAHIKLIEKKYSVTLLARGSSLQIDGDEKNIKMVAGLIHEMNQTLSRRGSLTTGDINKLIQLVNVENNIKPEMPEDVIHYARQGAISARTPGQNKYIEVVRKNDITLSIGPAGTGKTYMAVAFAVAALERHEVGRIILCRPAVEAGENLGFLPGDLKEKVDPYLAPLYDALADMLPQTKLKPWLAKKVIQVIPLAYMRGRTLDNAFLILDEAQNATSMQMKMFLTRLGVNSKTIINGDITQIDLPRKSDSGLIQVYDILRNIDGIGFVELTKSDVVRHRLVKEIIKAYELLDGNQD